MFFILGLLFFVNRQQITESFFRRKNASNTSLQYPCRQWKAWEVGIPAGMVDNATSPLGFNLPTTPKPQKQHKKKRRDSIAKKNSFDEIRNLNLLIHCLFGCCAAAAAAQKPLPLRLSLLYFFCILHCIMHWAGLNSFSLLLCLSLFVNLSTKFCLSLLVRTNKSPSLSRYLSVCMYVTFIPHFVAHFFCLLAFA